jgi:hypothetical protein
MSTQRENSLWVNLEELRTCGAFCGRDVRGSQKIAGFVPGS